jgi:dTDP-4-amino-4,6-dideoxygalactose transaminase
MRSAPLPYGRPSVGEDEIAGVLDCLRNGWLTTGSRVREFEQAFAELSGVRYAVALNSCTAALHLGLIALGVGPGDEVVMPSLTFVAGAQCARECGATPVFADVDEATLCITAETIAPVLTERTRAIMPMHYGGQPSGIGGIVELARSRGIRVLEDAAHCVGMLEQGRWAGALSDCAAYSFYPTKNITTGEGGMFLTNDADLMEEVRMLSLHGMNRDAWKRYTAGGSWRYDVVKPGFKYNLTDLAAAIGIGQLARLEELQQRRELLAQTYIEALRPIPGLRPVGEMLALPDRHAWCMFVLEVDEGEAGVTRDVLIEELRERMIGTSVHYIPTHQFSGYRHLPANVPVTDRLWQRILSLPLYPEMSLDDVEDVVAALRDSVPAAASRK